MYPRKVFSAGISVESFKSSRMIQKYVFFHFVELELPLRDSYRKNHYPR